MYFNRVVATGNRLEAYLGEELVRLRVRGAHGWVDLPIEGNGEVVERVEVKSSAGMPVVRKKEVGGRPELVYEDIQPDP